MILAEQGGVCGMIRTTCCTFIPNNTAPDGSVARALAGLQSLRLELAESSGINDPFTGWMESPMSDGRYRCSRCHPSLPGDRVYTGEFGWGTTRGARPDLAGEHRIDPLHHCPRASTQCSAPIHEDHLSHSNSCKHADNLKFLKTVLWWNIRFWVYYYDAYNYVTYFFKCILLCPFFV